MDIISMVRDATHTPYANLVCDLGVPLLAPMWAHDAYLPSDPPPLMSCSAPHVFRSSLSQYSKSRKLSGRHSGCPSWCEMQAQMQASAQAQTQARVQMQMQVQCMCVCVCVSAGLLYCTCSLQLITCRYRRRAGVPAAGTGIKDPMHRARRAPRPFPPCAISVAIISAKSDTTVKPHAIYNARNTRRVTRLPPPLAACACRRSRSPLRLQVYVAQQMRSFDVILQPAN